MKKTILDNGLTVITEQTDEDFVSMGYIVNKGSFDEPNDCLGIAHLAEHQVFKGTANRDKDEIWLDVQQYGGDMNAYTAENSTAFHCTILKEYWKTALDVISDIVFNNTVPEEEFELEKSVVIEELNMYHDDATHRVMENITKTIFRKYANRWTNGGTPETVRNITREQLINFINSNYIPSNITLMVTGNVKHEQICEFVSDYLEGYEFAKTSINNRVVNPIITIEDNVDTIEGIQSTMVAVWETKSSNTKETLINEIIAHVLGGGFGSRFMDIREKYGYAYTVRADTMTFDLNEPSLMFCYTALNKNNIEKTKELIVEKLNDLDKGITQKEFNHAKAFLTSDFKKAFRCCEDANSFKLDQYAVHDTIDKDVIIDTLNSIDLNDVNEFIKDMCRDMKIGFIVVEQSE